MNTPKYLIIHHEAPSVPIRDNQKRFKVVDDYHASKGWGGCGYHYFIERDGEIIQARQDNEEGAHTIGKNKDSLGICLAGNFDIQMPSDAQVKSLKTLLNQKMKAYMVFPTSIVGHRYFATFSLSGQGARGKNITSFKTWDNTQPYKLCPGNKLSDEWISNLIKVEPEAPETCAAEKKTIKTLTEYIASWIRNKK